MLNFGFVRAGKAATGCEELWDPAGRHWNGDCALLWSFVQRNVADGRKSEESGAGGVGGIKQSRGSSVWGFIFVRF